VHFASPILLVGLAIVPLLIWRRVRRRRDTAASLRYSDVTALAATGPTLRQRLRRGVFGARVAAIVLLVLAAARPQADRGLRSVVTEGIDICIALDVSGSMRTMDDGEQTRFQVVKHVIGEFVGDITNDRLGLVVFGAQAFTQCPLTLDYRVVSELLDAVHIGIVDEKRTAIGSAIATAATRLEGSAAKSKVAILLTDGLNNAGKIDPLTAAQAAEALDIRIYTIGVGKEGRGYALQDHPVFGRRRTMVHTDIDEETLREIARMTGGKFYRAEDEQTLARVHDAIWRLEKSKLRAPAYRRFRELLPWFLWPALGLLMLEIGLANTVLRKLP
jgi:Ca-activated chloride channel family protein